MRTAIYVIENLPCITEDDRKILLEYVKETVTPRIRNRMVEAVHDLHYKTIPDSWQEDKDFVGRKVYPHVYEFMVNMTKPIDVDSHSDGINVLIDDLKKENITDKGVIKEMNRLKKLNDHDFFVRIEMAEVVSMLASMMERKKQQDKMLIHGNDTEIQSKTNVTSNVSINNITSSTTSGPN